MMRLESGSRAALMEPVSAPAAVEALAGAVTTEVRLLEDLIGIMRRQRQAVAADDLPGVDDTVFATHRILVTLAEARRQRRSLCRLLAGSEDLALRLLDQALGELMSEELRFAMDGLRAVALTLSREVEMNRQVIRGALNAGDEYVRALYAPAESGHTYGTQARRPGMESSGGLLLNRQG